MSIKIFIILFGLFTVIQSEIIEDKCDISKKICTPKQLDTVMKFMCNSTYGIDEMYHDEIIDNCCHKKCKGYFLCKYCYESCCLISVDYN